jgi:hypothetical protein
VDIEGDDTDDDTYVPSWSVKRGARMNNATVCRDMMINLATPREEKYLDDQNDEEAVRRSWLLLGKCATAQADMMFRFESLQREYAKLSETHKICDKTLDDNWKVFQQMAGEFGELKRVHAECSEVNPEGMRKLRAENVSLEGRVSELEREKEEWRKVSGDQVEKIKLLEGQLSDAKNKLSEEEKAYKELYQEKVDIAVAAGTAKMERNRIVNEFVPEAIHRFLGSHEFRSALEEPFNLFYLSGLIDGAGMFEEPERAAELLGGVEGMDMEAGMKYGPLYDKALSQDYPYIQKIRGTIYRKFDELNALVPDPAPVEEPVIGDPEVESHIENPSENQSSGQNTSDFS